MMLNFGVSFLLTSIINIANHELFVPDSVQILGFAWMGIFIMALASTTWTVALESGETAKISNLAYITPFLSLVWTSFILKEKLSFYSIAGLLVIALGILIQMKKADY